MISREFFRGSAGAPVIRVGEVPRLESGRPDVSMFREAQLTGSFLLVRRTSRERRDGRKCAFPACSLPTPALDQRVEFLPLLGAPAHHGWESTRKVNAGSISPNCCITLIGSLPIATRVDANACRSLCGVVRVAAGCGPRSSTSQFARFTSGSTTSWRRLCRDRTGAGAPLSRRGRTRSSAAAGLAGTGVSRGDAKSGWGAARPLDRERAQIGHLSRTPTLWELPGFSARVRAPVNARKPVPFHGKDGVAGPNLTSVCRLLVRSWGERRGERRATGEGPSWPALTRDTPSKPDQKRSFSQLMQRNHVIQRRGGDSNPRWTDSPYRFSRPAHSTALPPLRWGRRNGSRTRLGRPEIRTRREPGPLSAGGGRRTPAEARRTPRPATRSPLGAGGSAGARRGR